jgi:hypothetical protein
MRTWKILRDCRAREFTTSLGVARLRNLTLAG